MACLVQNQMYTKQMLHKLHFSHYYIKVKYRTPFSSVSVRQMATVTGKCDEQQTQFMELALRGGPYTNTTTITPRTAS